MHNSQQMCVGQREAFGSRVVGMLLEPLHPLAGTPAHLPQALLPAPAASCNHPMRMLTHSLPPPVVYEDAKNSLRLACAVFQKKKYADMNPRDLNYFSHTRHTGRTSQQSAKRVSKETPISPFLHKLPTLISQTSWALRNIIVKI